MTRLELPDDGWAELRNPRKVSERKRRRYESAFFALNEGTAGLPRNPTNSAAPDVAAFGPHHQLLYRRIEDMRVLAVVSAWSYGEVTLEVWEDMPADAVKLLVDATEPMHAELLPDFSADPDPKAPTGGSTPAPTVSRQEMASTFATVSPDGTS